MEEKDKHEVEISQKALRNRNKAKKANFFSQKSMTQFKQYFQCFQDCLGSVNVDQLVLLKKKYRFYLQKLEAFEEKKNQLQQKLENLQNIVNESQPIMQLKQSIQSIEQIVADSKAKLENTNEKVSIVKSIKKQRQNQIKDLKEAITQEKNIFFNLKRQQMHIRNELQQKIRLRDLQLANQRFKSILASKAHPTRAQSRKTTMKPNLIICQEGNQNIQSKISSYSNIMEQQRSQQNYIHQSNHKKNISLSTFKQKQNIILSKKDSSLLKFKQKYSLTSENGKSQQLSKTNKTFFPKLLNQSDKKQFSSTLYASNKKTKYQQKPNQFNILSQMNKINELKRQLYIHIQINQKNQSKKLDSKYQTFSDLFIGSSDKKNKFPNKLKLNSSQFKNSLKQQKQNIHPFRQCPKFSKNSSILDEQDQKLLITPDTLQIFQKREENLNKFLLLSPPQIINIISRTNQINKIVSIIQKQHRLVTLKQ